MTRLPPPFWSMVDDAQAIHDKTATCVRHARILMGEDSGAPLEKKDRSDEVSEELTKGAADPKIM